MDPSSNLSKSAVLQRYTKDFEEMMRAIKIRNSDTYRWF